MVLHKGKFENDFENYGVDIMVKYRDREPLQRLTAHHQVQYDSSSMRGAARCPPHMPNRVKIKFCQRVPE